MILIQQGSLLLFPLLTLMTFLGSLPFFPRMSGTEIGELILLNLSLKFSEKYWCCSLKSKYVLFLS